MQVPMRRSSVKLREMKIYVILLGFFFKCSFFAQSYHIDTLSITQSARLNWTTVKENAVPYVIEQLLVDKWVRVGKHESVGIIGSAQYSFQAVPHSGENVFRLRKEDGSDDGRTVKYTSQSAPVTYKMIKKKVEFSSDTFYEIDDASGKTVKKGYAGNVGIDDLPKGIYLLYYDNIKTEFSR